MSLTSEDLLAHEQLNWLRGSLMNKASCLNWGCLRRSCGKHQLANFLRTSGEDQLLAGLEREPGLGLRVLLLGDWLLDRSLILASLLLESSEGERLYCSQENSC